MIFIHYYFDMDGVLVTWDPTLDHYVLGVHALKYGVPDSRIVSVFQKLHARGNACVISNFNLSASPEHVHMMPEWLEDKKFWVAHNLPYADINRDFHFITGNKTDILDERKIPRDERLSHVLIDDYNPNLRAWEAAGGLAVKYCNGLNDPKSWNGLSLLEQWDSDKILSVLESLSQKEPFQWLSETAAVMAGIHGTN